jgi:uncharacterized membrane protein
VLGVWVWLQSRHASALARRVEALEAQLRLLVDAPPKVAQHELLLTEEVAQDELLLDTPLPEASNDTAGPEPLPELVLGEPVPEPEPAHPSRAKPARPRFDQWLAEKGLAWLGGGAFALGAAYLVSVAAQQNWFTAPVRLASALVLGATLLGVSEWTRRASVRRPPGHPLLSALFAGAGVVALYAVAWAAYGLYGFLGAAPAVAMLIACAVLLAALSFLHGQALGLLAVAMALLAPAITTAPAWSSPALTLFVCGVSLSGLALAALRRWAWAALAALAGLYFWFFEALAANEIRRALVFLSVASLPALALILRKPLEDAAPSRLSWGHVHALGPSVAIAVSSAMVIWAWLALAPASGVFAPALAAIYHVALSAYAVRARVVLQSTLLIAIGALVFGFAGYLRARFLFGAPAPDFYPAILLSALAVTLATLSARPHARERTLTALTGALGAAALCAMAAVSRPDWQSLAASAALFGGALLSFAAAQRWQRDSSVLATDAAINWWAGAGAALVLLGVESALPASFRVLGHGAASLGFAAGLRWRGWRIFGAAALTAAALSLGHAVAPDFVSAALNNTNPIWRALAVVAAGAGCLFGASELIKRADGHRNTHEALHSAGVIALLAGGFIALRWVAAGGAGAQIDAFTESSLRAIALLAAGYTLAPRDMQGAGVIGAWRGHALLCAGLGYVLAWPSLVLNPWWGLDPAHVQGAPVVNALTLAFAAPAAIAIAAARRHYAALPLLSRFYGGAGAVLALLWAILHIRHSFHGASMSGNQAGLFEAACYPLAGLLIATLASVWISWRAKQSGASSHDLLRACWMLSWAALCCAIFLMLFAFHPIWGRHDASASNETSTLLATLSQGAGAILALALALMLDRLAFDKAARFAAAASSALFALSFGHSIVRWFHHRAFMDDGAPPLGLEGVAHALWPVAFVLAGAWLTRFLAIQLGPSALERDFNAIWASVIWGALGFAGLGLWLLFNPWWGLEPVRFYTVAGAGMALTSYLAAAALSYVARSLHGIWRKRAFDKAAIVACAAHLFVAATLVVRWLYHSDELIRGRTGETELWAYSAVWAMFGAAALALGVIKKSLVLRWIGLAVLLATTAKVVIVDTSRLSGFVRAASLIGLAVMLSAAAWAARRYAPKPNPGELITVTPSNGPRKRYVRNRAQTKTDQPT